MKHRTNMNTFHEKLKMLIHEYIMLTYVHSKEYPNDERFGLTSQDRRSSVSIMLNYVEGYARMRIAVKQNMYETSFGSLKESIYCRFLARELGYISDEDYTSAHELKEQIAPMLYASIQGIKNKRAL